MSNTNDTELPSLSAAFARGNISCAVVRPYLAIVEELPPDQAQIVMAHVQICPDCTLELQQLTQANRLIASLPVSGPSTRVDRAVLAAIAARGMQAPLVRALPLDQQTHRGRSRKQGRVLSWTSALAVAAVLALAATFLFHNLTSPAEAFALPANLSWNGYVLHYNVEHANDSGSNYLMDCYQDLGKQNLHAETSKAGQWDIVLVGDQQSMLGKDMMHQVAQENIDGWDLCSPQFNLNSLRTAIQQKQSVYVGKRQFDGEDVYQIRNNNGLILLLNMDYRPVNALQPTTVMSGSTAHTVYHPLYTQVDLMSSSQVENSMWDRSVPPRFHMGTITVMP